MLIALLALLGVDPVVPVALVAAVTGRRRRVTRQPGAFHGVPRDVSADASRFHRTWRRGHARWVRDVLVWTP
jgi:hypothetical protein